MPSAAVHLLESLLQRHKLARTLLQPAEAPRVLATGLSGLDEEIGGGWRLGAVSEVVGPRSSGRTRVLLATLAAATARGQVAALVDTLDRFDPRGADAAGVDLSRLLWVRGAPVTVELARPPVIDLAVRQAVRAFDLILRAGGFAVVALDVCDVPARRIQALPAVTWLRLGHVVEGQETVGLLVGDAPMGRSARGVSVALSAPVVWSGTSAQSRRLADVSPRFTRRSGALAHGAVSSRRPYAVGQG